VSTSSSASRVRARREIASNHAHARAQGKPPLITRACSPAHSPSLPLPPVVPASPLSLLPGSAAGRPCRRRTSTRTCLHIAPGGGADGADPVRRFHEGVATARRGRREQVLHRGSPVHLCRGSLVHPCRFDLCRGRRAVHLCRGRRSLVLHAGLVMNNLLLSFSS
jgi:ferric-dicitrate binding protein FerR (iron transport regulator)